MATVCAAMTVVLGLKIGAGSPPKFGGSLLIVVGSNDLGVVDGRLWAGSPESEVTSLGLIGDGVLPSRGSFGCDVTGSA